MASSDPSQFSFIQSDMLAQNLAAEMNLDCYHGPITDKQNDPLAVPDERNSKKLSLSSSPQQNKPNCWLRVERRIALKARSNKCDQSQIIRLRIAGLDSGTAQFDSVEEPILCALL